MIRLYLVFLFAGTLLRAEDDSTAMRQAAEASELGYTDKAIADYTTVLQANPKNVAALLGRGEAYAQKADSDKSATDKAIADFTRVIALDPKNGKAWFDRGNIEYERGFFGNKPELQNALDDFTQAIQLYPKDAEAWRMRGMVYGALFDRQRELADDNSAIQADPKDSAAWGDRAVAYSKLHQYDKAVADDTQAIKLEPGEQGEGYYEDRASAYEQMKDYARAVADYTKATELVPNDSDAFTSLAEILSGCPDPKVRDGKKAVAAASEGCELSHNNDPRAFEALAAAYAENGDFDNAVKWQMKALVFLGESPGTDPRLKLYQAHKPFRDDGTDLDD